MINSRGERSVSSWPMEYFGILRCAQDDSNNDYCLQTRHKESQRSLAQNGRLVGGSSLLIRGGFCFLGNGLRFGVGLVVDEVLLGFGYLGAGKGGVAPAFDFDALALEVLVDGEEVGDLAEHVGVDLGEVPDVLVARVVFADAEDLLVAKALVEHLQNADGADLHDTAGEAGGVDQDEAVEGVAVVGEGAGDEAVVAGIVDGGVEIAVETEDLEFLVVLVLVDCPRRGFR